MGQRKGYKQTPEHIEKRKRWGKKHHAWKGDFSKNPRKRAHSRLPILGPCQRCKTMVKKRERHHKDGNPYNNKRSNLRVLCRKCHMIEDGRLESVKASMYQVQKLGTIAAAKVRVHPSGVAGISWYKSRNMWLVRKCEGGVRHHVGYFREFKMAVQALKGSK